MARTKYGSSSPADNPGESVDASSKRKQKRQAEATEQEGKKREVEDTKYREFQMKFEAATVAQKKGELEAQRFYSEMARLSKLIEPFVYCGHCNEWSGVAWMKSLTQRRVTPSPQAGGR